MLTKNHLKITGSYCNYNIRLDMSHKTLKEVKARLDEIVSSIQKYEKEIKKLSKKTDNSEGEE